MAAAHSGLNRLRQALDPEFAKAGLSPGPRTVGSAASYEGEVEGRKVSVACSARATHRYATPGISYRQFAGLHLQITVETPLQANLVVQQPLGIRLAGMDNIVVRGVIRAAERWGNRNNGMSIVPSPPGEFPVSATAADPSWASQTLTVELRRTLWDLLPARNLGLISPVGGWSLSVSPGKLIVGLTPEASTLHGWNVAHWLKLAVGLARQAERFTPAPLPPDTVSPPPAAPGSVRKTLLPKLLMGLGCLAMVPVLLLVLFGIGFLAIGEKVLIAPILFALVFMPYAFYLLVRNFIRKAAHARRGATHGSQQARPEDGTA